MSRRGLSEDFESIFRDTENNISSIKRQLDKGRNQYIPRSPINNVANPSYGPTSPNKSLTKTNSCYSPQTSSQTTLITSMFKRLEEQSKTIAVLEQMIQHQGKEIQRIKEKQNDYKNSLEESSNFDFHHKIEKVERKLRGEIETIWTSIRSSTKLSEENGFNKSRDDLSRDIKSQRRLIEDESESLRREVDGLKTKIARIEAEVNTSLKEALDVNRKYGEVERDVSTIMASQRSLRGDTQRGETQLKEIKNELEQIGSMMTNVRSDNNSSYAKKNVVKKSKARIELDDDTSFRDAFKVNGKYGDVERDMNNIMASHRSFRGDTQRGQTQLKEIKNELEEIGSMLTSVRSDNSSLVKKNGSKKSKADYIFGKDTSHALKKESMSSFIADSPTPTLLSDASNIDISLDSSNFSDKGELNTETRTDQLLNEDNLRLELSDADDDLLFLEKDGSSISFDDLQLSDDVSALTDDLL